jgi:hypothetical protein
MAPEPPRSLLDRVTTILGDARIDAVLIGAAAMAAHGVARSTADLDLLVTDDRVLDPGFWSPRLGERVSTRIRRGGAEAKLAGVVTILAEGERPVDLVVGRAPWLAELARRSSPRTVLGSELRVAGRADLALLKLYAGGLQDAWDVLQLLASGDAVAMRREVELRLPSLPEGCRALWRDLEAGRIPRG